MNTRNQHRGEHARGRSFGRPSFNHTRRGASHGASVRRGGYASARSRFGGGRGGGGPRGLRIDVSRFVKKAVAELKEETYVPKNSFSDFSIHESLKQNIAKKRYISPTPIQDGAIPLIIDGKDIVGIAHTGTGKTGAFLIPLIDKVLRVRSERVLVIVPTRELAIQIEEEFWGFADRLRIGAVSCVGGANINRQIATLRRDPHFVIGTPGRIKDLIERRVLDLSRFRTVVLDEADRMLDMGFIVDIKRILSHTPRERHTLFFSATLSRDIEALIGGFLREPTRVSVKTGEVVESVEQDIVRIQNGKTKIDVLHNLLIQPDFVKVLVFGRTKHGVERLAKTLSARGFKAESIHGNKNQSKRQRALSRFKDNLAQVLVATDVAARGIDVAGVSHVVNYDLPNTYEDYVHRIGRTGRAGKRGKALTFIE